MPDEDLEAPADQRRPEPQPTRPSPTVPETYGMGWPFERKPKDRKNKKAR